MGKVIETTVCKVNEELGIVFGWAMISTENGEPYVDTQDDHIPEEEMLKASAEFMESHRALKAMHRGDAIGSVVYAWPLTQELADAFGIKTNKTGLMVGVKPADDDVLQKFRDGEYTGFSIGGVADKEEME